jgi:putative oxidoreductase
MSETHSLVSLVARILMSIIFISAGLEKITGYEASAAYMQGHGLPGALLPLAIATELGGGLAVLLGIFSRWAGLLLAGFCLVTAALFHFDLADQIQTIMLMKNLAMAGGLLLLYVNGPGRYAIRD